MTPINIKQHFFEMTTKEVSKYKDMVIDIIRVDAM